MAEGSPFLLSLGIAPSIVSLIWLAGPVCGTILQPFIGHRSDHCTHKWGRRRPYIVWGTLAAITCINLLAWTGETVQLACLVLGLNPYSRIPSLIIKILAVIWVWGLNFSLQPVQVGLRALTVDVCPDTQQSEAGTFTSCIVLLGSLVGYGAGFLKMPAPNTPGLVENAQFKGVCLIASICLAVAAAITAMATTERRLTADCKVHWKADIREVFQDICKTAKSLPHAVRTACLVQFFSWMAWFPFLFYGVTYLSKLYETSILLAKMGPPSNRFYHALHEQSLRHGTLALVLFSCVALLTNIGLPYLIQETPPRMVRPVNSAGIAYNRTWKYLTLPRAWMLAHVLTGICLFALTIREDFVFSVGFVALLGISWGLTQWAPFAIIGAEIAPGSIDGHPYQYHSIAALETSSSDPLAAIVAIDAEKQQHHSNYLFEAPRSTAATVMSVHNIAMSLPQIASAIISSLIFKILSPLNLGPTETLAWVLRVGVMAAACAAYLARNF